MSYSIYEDAKLVMPNKILAVLDGAAGTEPLIASLAHFSTVTVIYPVAQAMEILRGQRVDLIIADVHLQDDSGFVQTVFDFLRWIKGDPQLRDIPFMCYSYAETGVPKYALEAVRLSAKLLGAASFISESNSDSDDLKQQIQWLLPKRQNID